MNRLLAIVCLTILSFSCIPATPNSNRGKKKSTPPAKNLEIPALKRGESVITHPGFFVSFNSEYLIPNWVAYELTEEETMGTFRRPSNSPFQSDPLCKGRQPERSDYSHSGWDKGHLAPCADMKWSEQAMIESFYFTNVCPQDHLFNERDWQKTEDLGRTVAKHKGAVYIVCGPIVNTNEFGRIGSNQVVIPDAFFKAFLYKDSDGFHSIGFIMPNKYTSAPIMDCAMCVNELERQIGIDLFVGLNDSVEESVENQMIISDWKFK